MPKTNINLLIRDIQRNFDNHAIAFDVHALYEHPLHVLIKIAAEHTDLRVYLIGCIDALLRQLPTSISWMPMVIHHFI